MKKILFAALAAAVLFASCAKDGDNTPANGDTRTVQIQIKRTDSGTRSVGGQVADATAVSFTSGKLLFTNAVDAITMIVAINPGAAAYDGTAKTVGVEALEATGGEWITGVPGASIKVYFIGNEPAGMTAPALNVKVSDLVASVTSQWKSDGSVDNVTIFGGEALTQYTGGGAEADQYEAEFDVKPIAARFEIGAITGLGDVESFDIDGIFIDNYYNTMNLNGTAIAADLKTNGPTVAKYVTDGAGGSYTTAMLGRVFDYNASGLTAPTAGNAWAYNLLAPTSATPAMPTIVIRLSNVVVDGQNWPSPQFLSIQNLYSDAGTNSVNITELEQGNIYLIPEIEFTEENLAPEPFLKTKRVRVEVTMMDWELNTVGYDFD